MDRWNLCILLIPLLNGLESHSAHHTAACPPPSPVTTCCCCCTTTGCAVGVVGVCGGGGCCGGGRTAASADTIHPSHTWVHVCVCACVCVLISLTCCWWVCGWGGLEEASKLRPVSTFAPGWSQIAGSDWALMWNGKQQHRHRHRCGVSVRCA